MMQNRLSVFPSRHQLGIKGWPVCISRQSRVKSLRQDKPTCGFHPVSCPVNGDFHLPLTLRQVLKFLPSEMRQNTAACNYPQEKLRSRRQSC
jgi:hypothetical protein